MAHLSDPTPRLSEIRSDLPAAMDEVIAEGMAKDPAQRPASAGELMLKARRALGAAPAAGPSPTQTTRPGVGGGSPTRAAGTAVQDDQGATRTAGAAVTAPAMTSALAGAPTRASASVDAGTRDARAARSAGRGGFALAALAAAVVAAAVGFLLGGGSGGSGEAFSNTASAGYLELSFPAGWQHLASAPAIPGLAFSQPLALAPVAAGAGGAGSGGERLVAGEVSASGPSLLPAAFTSALSGAPPHPEAVRLGALEAYRYSGLSVQGLAGALTLYAVPTAGGVATVVCLGPGAAAASAQCSQIAATLKLNGVSAFGLAPSTRYAAALARVFATLNGAASAGAVSLRAATSASAQAAAASRLATAFSSASSAVGRLAASPAVQSLNASVASSLAALAHGYSALAAAARAGEEGAYAAATHAIAADRARAASALAALRQAGYEVPG